MSDKWLVFSDEDTDNEQVGTEEQKVNLNTSAVNKDSANNTKKIIDQIDNKEVGILHDDISTAQSTIQVIKSKEVDAKAQNSTIQSSTKDPHIQQYQRQMGRQPPCQGYTFSDNSIRILKYNDERAPYRRRQNECKTVFHDQYLSTVLPLIEFLTDYAIPAREEENETNHETPGLPQKESTKFTVAVVFNRPLWCLNAHLLLCTLFPHANFHVFEVFSKIGIEAPGLNVYNFSITDSRFQRIRQDLHGDILYANINDENQFQMQRAKDPGPAFQHSLETQRLHIHQLRPLAALCRLQLPYDKAETTFFQGTSLLPIFDTATGAAVHLLVKPENQTGERTYKMDVYSNQKHEEQMFYFNTVRRVTCYTYEEQFNFECFRRFDHCYDCTCFYNICLRYLKAARGVDGTKKQLHMVWLYNQIDSSRPERLENRKSHSVPNNI